MHIGQRHRVNIVGASGRSVPVGPGEREAAVSHEPRAKAEIAGHANGRLDRIVRDDAGHDQRVVAAGSKPGFQIGSDERAVRLFRDDGFAGHRSGLRLEFVSRLARPVVRLRVCGVVPNVPYRPALAAPMDEQPANLRLRTRVVSFSPTRMVDRSLQVDQQEDGARRRKE